MNWKLALIFSLVGTGLIGLTVAFAPASGRSAEAAECCDAAVECCDVACDPDDCVTCDEGDCAEVCKDNDNCCVVCCDKSACDEKDACKAPAKSAGCASAATSCGKAPVKKS